MSMSGKPNGNGSPSQGMNKAHSCIVGIILIIIFHLIILMFLIGGVEGKTIIVDDMENGDYEQIQDAIDNAEAGDTISVWKGDYEKNVIVDKPLNIIGNGSRESEIMVTTGHPITITADGCTIQGLNVIGGGGGIFVESDNNMISDNIIEEISGSGIVVSGNFSIISNNTILNSTGGIQVRGGNENILVRNEVKNIKYGGIKLSDSFANILYSNTLVNSSFSMYGESLLSWDSHVVPENNTVNGYPIYYIKNTDKITVPVGPRSMIFVNCTNLSINNITLQSSNDLIDIAFSSDLIVENISMKNSHNCFNIYNSTYLVIRNNFICNNSYSIRIMGDSHHILIENNTIWNNLDNGIRFGEFLHSITIISNSIMDNEYDGIFFSQYNNKNNIYNNLISNNSGTGLRLVGDLNKIHNNTIEGNVEDAIFIRGNYNTISNNSIVNNSANGICIDYGDSNYLSGNTIMNNLGHGMLVDGGKYNNITNNVIENNVEYGIISEWYSDSFNISGNRIVGNGKDGIFVEDSISLRIENNFVENNNGYGINLERNSQWSIITNNTILKNSGYGIKLYSVYSSIISHNVIRDCENGIDGSGTQCQIRYNIIENMTSNGIESRGSSNITNNRIRNNEGIGIFVQSSSTAIIEWNEITGNYIGIKVYSDRDNSIIRYCSIQGNTQYGFLQYKSSGSVGINASWNWWGDITGPNHEGVNPLGLGDNITVVTQFAPWLWGDPFLENSAPTAIIDSIFPDPGFARKPTVLSADGIDNTQIVEYRWDSDIDGLLYIGSQSIVSTDSLSEGNHTISLKVKDEVGMWSEAVTRELLVVVAPPWTELSVIRITSPSNNSIVRGTIDVLGDGSYPSWSNVTIEYRINEGEWSRLNNISANNSFSFKVDTDEFADTNNVIYVRAVNEENQSVTSSVHLTLQSEDDETRGLKPIIIAGSLVTLGLVIIGFLLNWNGNLRFTLFSIVLIPLYSRLEREDILLHEKRSTIFSYVAENPGETYSNIKENLSLGTSTLVHHLRVLEREGLLRSQKNMGRRLFFPRDLKEDHSHTDKVPISPIQKKIVVYLKKNGPTTRLQLEEKLSMKRQTIDYSVRRLEYRGMIKCDGNKRSDHCFIVAD